MSPTATLGLRLDQSAAMLENPVKVASPRHPRLQMRPEQSRVNKASLKRASSPRPMHEAGMEAVH